MKPPTNPIQCGRVLTLRGDDEHDITTLPEPDGTRSLYVVCLVESSDEEEP
jgi:hypothetical protein